MKHIKLILIPALGMILAGCNETQQQIPPKPPVIIDNGGEEGGNENTPPATYIKDELSTPIPFGGVLPIGNSIVTSPLNLTTPDDIGEEKVYNSYDSMPTNWSFISGNNKVSSAADWYNETVGGGLKFRKQYYGVQSCAFKGYKYTYISFKVSAVENRSKDVISGPIFHVYGYDKNNQCILQKNIEQGSINASTKGNYVTLEIHNEDMMYFELRQSAYPMKGEQCYNIGISEFKLKGNN